VGFYFGLNWTPHLEQNLGLYAFPKYPLQEGHLQLSKENIKTPMISVKETPRTIPGESPKRPPDLSSTDIKPINARTTGARARI
jgi:hypothetical protein